MRIEALLPRQGDCLKCPEPIPCNCAPNQDCFQIGRDCFSCSQTKCVTRGTSGTGGSSSSGVGKGATAGAIVGALIFLGIAVAVFFFYRRRMRLRRHRTAVHEPPKDIPAPAETVLNRPDPTEKPNTPSQLNSVRVYSNPSNTTIAVGSHSRPSSHRSSPHTNPFDDTTSIQTAGTEGTNVIPIALVPADSQRPSSLVSEGHSQASGSSNPPVRPARSPDLNLDHVNVSRDSVRGPPNYAQSTRSGMSGFTHRNSYMSSASFASDVLNEPPQIITPTQGAVRQVLGVVKAEVINAPAPVPTSNDSLKPPSTSRPAIRSPLASKSFGPGDMVTEADENQLDPFSDNASINAEYGVSPAPTATSFAHHSTSAVRGSQPEWVETPNMPWPQINDNTSRPSSISTQAATSEVDIASATRVKVGFAEYAANPLGNPSGAPRSPYRTTMGRLVSPTTPDPGNLQDQQQKALAHAQTQSHDLSRRASSGSAMSAASSIHADSILEGFPIVPPSPISNRPIRSPPVSPLGQQYFSPPSPAAANHTINVAPPSPHVQQSFTDERHQSHASDESSLPPPPNRRTLGLSTGSQLSTASSGLGSFAFQIDSGDGAVSTPPSSFNNHNRQRASLDTLALTSDLSSYPLGFDRESVQMPMPQRQKHNQ